MTRNLSPKQLKAAALLAEGISHSEIARRLGVSVRTVDRWAVKPEIRQIVLDTQAQVFQKVGDEIFQKCKQALIRGLPKAVTKILLALDDSDTKIQIRAADAVVKWAGFYQPSVQNKPAEPQTNPEESMKSYLQFLASKNKTNEL